MEAVATRPGVLESEPAPSAPASADPLFRKLSWLSAFRLLTITVLLGGTAVADLRSTALQEGPGPLYILIVATYAASLGFALALRARWRLALVAQAQVALDVAIAGTVVALTGHSDSIFVFLFSLAIVNGSILMFRRGALVGTILSLLTYLPVVLLGASRPQPFLLFVHASAFVATAVLSGYLAEQLRRTGERLAVREDDLAAITALHESIVQSVTSGLVTIDPQGRIMFLNRAAEQMTGLSNAVARGQPAMRWFAAFVPGITRGETDLKNERGERLRAGYTIFPLVSSDSGRTLGSAIIFQDLTSVRAMEEEMKRSERLADLGRLAAGLAHELRNPLASMTGSIELLRGSRALNEEDARLMEIVLREGARLDQLVTHLLTFTRPESQHRIEVDLADVARDTLEVFANDPAAARVRVDRDLAPARAWCDPDQVRQVLWNLLRNAAESAGAREHEAGVIALRSRTASGNALIVVEDNGAGIPAADLPHVFAPFFTTKAKGSGLGLATVQRIVDAHGGSVSLESPTGGGARFSVSLPGAPIHT